MARALEVDWQAASAAGEDDGSIALWIDDVEQTSLTGLDNDTHTLDEIRLGAGVGAFINTFNTPDPDSLYLDAYESRRFSYIGLDPGIVLALKLGIPHTARSAAAPAAQTAGLPRAPLMWLDAVQLEAGGEPTPFAPEATVTRKPAPNAPETDDLEIVRQALQQPHNMPTTPVGQDIHLSLGAPPSPASGRYIASGGVFFPRGTLDGKNAVFKSDGRHDFIVDDDIQRK